MWLITQHFCCKQIEKVLELFSSFKEEKIPLTVEIFNIIISAYARVGRIRKAFKFYNDVSFHICCS